MTRLPEGFDFLVKLVERDSRHSVAALEALGRIAPAAELRGRLEKAVEETGSERLRASFEEHFGSSLP